MIFMKKSPFVTHLISLIMVSLLTSSCEESNKPLVIGHRGAKGHVAENTLPSISKALEMGVDGVEIDVFLCRSGELVVFHDKTLEKLSDGEGFIEELTLDSIRKISVLGGYKIPTLNEVLDLIQGSVFLNIELKGSGTAKPTEKLIKEYLKKGKWNAQQFIISSFNWEELEIFYQLNQNIPIAVLTGADPLDAIPIAKGLNAQAINPNFRALTQKNVEKMQKEGFKVFPYTINEPEHIEKMLAFKVDGIITDYPERVSEALSED